MGKKEVNKLDQLSKLSDRIFVCCALFMILLIPHSLEKPIQRILDIVFFFGTILLMAIMASMFIYTIIVARRNMRVLKFFSESSYVIYRSKLVRSLLIGAIMYIILILYLRYIILNP